jgi:RND family efflux transporter MFP subunit
MSSSLRDELASLKIERRGSIPGPSRKNQPGRRIEGSGFGLKLLSLLIWLIPLTMIGVGAAFAYKQYKELQSKPEVSVGHVQAMTSGEAEKLLSAKGYLRSRYQADVGSRVAGRVQELLIEEGTKVKKGQLLVVLEHNDLDANLESRRAMMLRARADIEEAKADLEYKRSKSERTKRLQIKNISVSTEEAQQAISAVDMALAHVAALEAGLRLQESQVHEMQVSVDNMKIVAPFDGTVIARPADLGEQIAVDKVLTLADFDHMEVETDIAENLLSRIAIGQPAEISVSAVPSKHYRGRLRRIIPTSDRARGTVKVRVEILDSDEHLFPELVATVHFLPDKAHQGPDVGKSHLFVPKQALFEESGHSNVWLVDAKNALHKTRVEVVVTNEELARVESGLKPGDAVVLLSKSQALHEGELVKVAD